MARHHLDAPTGALARVRWTAEQQAAAVSMLLGGEVRVRWAEPG
jgi:hypothetical protein